MVYLGVRNRKINKISRVNALIKAKLESKVAKTCGLLTAALILSFLPATGIALLGNSVLEANLYFRLGETLVQLNSLISPILYCYRDRQFRKAVLELLGMRKPHGHASQTAAVAARFVRRNKSFGSVEQLKKTVGYKGSSELVPRSSSSIKNGNRHVYMQPRMTRSASCNTVIFVDCAHLLANPHEMFLGRKRSASI